MLLTKVGDRQKKVKGAAPWAKWHIQASKSFLCTEKKRQKLIFETLQNTGDSKTKHIVKFNPNNDTEKQCWDRDQLAIKLLISILASDDPK